MDLTEENKQMLVPKRCHLVKKVASVTPNVGVVKHHAI